MMIVSYNWTTAPLVNGAKTQTWRSWDHDYARRFQPGNHVQAWDRGPRNHGVHVATLLVVSCGEQRSDLMPESFYETEGLAWMAAHPESHPKTIFGHPFTPYQVSRERFNEWRRSAEWGYVLTTEIITLLPGADRYLIHQKGSPHAETEIPPPPGRPHAREL